MTENKVWPIVFYDGNEVLVKDLDYLRPRNKKGIVIRWHPGYSEDGDTTHYFYSVLIDGLEYLLRDDEMERI